MDIEQLNPILQLILKRHSVDVDSLTQDKLEAILLDVGFVISDIEAHKKDCEVDLAMVSKELKQINSDINNQAELNLKKQKEHFLSIINSMRDGLCVINASGTITFANPIACVLLGINKLVGENFLTYMSVPDIEVIVPKSKDDFSGVVEIIKNSGECLNLRISSSLLNTRSNMMLERVLVFSDCGVELEINARLEEARDRALETTRLKSEFLATMSHEIRTPLNGIVSLVTLLELSELTDEQREDLADIKVSSDQLNRIICNVLDLAKIETGMMFLDKQRFSLKRLQSDIYSMFKGSFESKEISFISEVFGEFPEHLFADYTRLKQVISNLIGNAIKFTGEGGFVLFIIKGSAVKNGNYNIDFAIVDNGTGVPLSKIPTLFDSFVQADGSITRKYGGSGLGLSICKNLVDIMGGKIQVFSREGIGSQFRFTIPMEKSDQDRSHSKNRIVKSVQSAEAVSEELSRAKKKILVVDDNSINLSTLTRYLNKSGLNAVTASSGLEAIEKISSENFDLILLDLQMPEMSGYETIRHIRENEKVDPILPIVALTANVLLDTEQSCYDAGFNGYLSKPIDCIELLKRIDSFFVDKN